jgi:hypothetical protein
LQLLSSWWWAWGCPKHIELYLNDKQLTWKIAASVGWLIGMYSDARTCKKPKPMSYVTLGPKMIIF